MCQKITVQDVLAFLEKATEDELKNYYAFNIVVAELFQATALVLNNMPDMKVLFGKHPRGASRSQRRRRARHLNECVLSVMSVRSIISQSSKISLKDAGFVSAIKEMFLIDFSLNIKEPFMADVFKIEKRENNNFYIVREKKSGPPAAVLKKYIGKNEMLQMEKLSADITEELTVLLKVLKLPAVVTRTDKAVCVNLNYANLLLIEPHVPVSSMIWKDCPDLVLIGEIPKLVQKTIREIREEEDLAIFVPLSSKVLPSCYEEVMEKAIYYRVEMEFFMRNQSFTEMVKLVTIAHYHYAWLGVGMSEELIRRIALREADTLCFKTKWEGYSHILNTIKEEVVCGFFERDFFLDSPQLGIEREMIRPFLKSVDEALKLLPEDLLDMAEKIQHYSGLEDYALFDYDYYEYSDDDDDEIYDYDDDDDCDFEI